MNALIEQLRKNNFVIDGRNAYPPGSPEAIAALQRNAGQPIKARTQKTFKAFVPAQVVSEANNTDSLGKKLKRKKLQKIEVARAFGFVLNGRGVPKSVTLVLLTEHEQDGDNLQRSLKAHRDQIARMCGFDDKADVWKYGQERLRSFEARGVWIRVQF